MESWHRGASRVSLLFRLAAIAMVFGAIVIGNGDGGIRFSTTLAHGSVAPKVDAVVTCTGGALAPGDGTKDLQIIGPCTATGGIYQYKDVNIYKDVTNGGDANGGSLTFTDATGAINFWANSILIENHGALIAGSQTAPFVSPLTFHLYGVEQNKNDSGLKGVGIPCKSPITPTSPFCGISKEFWDSNPNPNPGSCVKASDVGDGKTLLPGGVDDCFYQYHPLNFDNGDLNAFFGYKVLAVSFGGKLQLFGAKGATYCASYPCPANDPALQA